MSEDILVSKLREYFAKCPEKDLVDYAEVIVEFGSVTNKKPIPNLGISLYLNLLDHFGVNTLEALCRPVDLDIDDEFYPYGYYSVSHDNELPGLIIYHIFEALAQSNDVFQSKVSFQWANAKTPHEKAAAFDLLDHQVRTYWDGIKTATENS